MQGQSSRFPQDEDTQIVCVEAVHPTSWSSKVPQTRGEDETVHTDTSEPRCYDVTVSVTLSHRATYILAARMGRLGRESVTFGPKG